MNFKDTTLSKLFFSLGLVDLAPEQADKKNLAKLDFHCTVNNNKSIYQPAR